MSSRRIRRLLAAFTASAAMAVGLVVPTAGSANAVESTTFSWHTLRSGDCTMFDNASWTLFSNGTAKFDGTVTSSANNDAWLMWAHLLDANNAEFGVLANTSVQNPRDRGEFVKNLPNHKSRYRWFASGTFNSHLYPLIKHMRLTSHC